MIQGLLTVALICAALLNPRPAMAHPHVFVDARIDAVVDDHGVLQALEVTWRFDPFHTLYILSFDGVTPSDDGGLTLADQDALSAAYTDWQGGFDGFAKLFIDGAPIALASPSAVRASLKNDQLEISFTRVLPHPEVLADVKAEIAIYDATYYHAIKVAAPPRIRGQGQGCHATLLAFDPDRLSASSQAALEDLHKERAPEVENVGRLFADRITLSCA
ncbi:MAG: DUF1007 family protein [Pseudomonadota bacterium]